MVLIFMILKICYSVKTLVSVERVNSPTIKRKRASHYMKYKTSSCISTCFTMVLVFLMEIFITWSWVSLNNNLIVYFLWRKWNNWWSQHIYISQCLKLFSMISLLKYYVDLKGRIHCSQRSFVISWITSVWITRHQRSFLN